MMDDNTIALEKVESHRKTLPDMISIFRCRLRMDSPLCTGCAYLQCEKMEKTKQIQVLCEDTEQIS